MEKATLQQTKEHNRRLIYDTIFPYPAGTSRASLSRETGLAKPTVSEIVAELVEEGWLEEVGMGVSSGGKPPLMLRLKEDARNILCLDLSGGRFSGGVFNLRGHLLARRWRDLQGRQGEPLLSCLMDLISELLDLAMAPVMGLTIGVPGLVNPDEGRVIHSISLDWTDFNLVDRLRPQFSFPIYLANDSHLAAYAECAVRGNGSGNLLLVNTNKGIGAGLILHGDLFWGDHFNAGELGHVQIQPDGEKCECGHLGCLETISSVEAIIRKTRKVHVPCEWNDVVDMVQAGDMAVLQVIYDGADALGRALAQAAGLLNIQDIVIAGKITQLGNPFLNRLQKTFSESVLSSIADQSHLSYARYDEDIILHGAVAWMMRLPIDFIQKEE